METKHGSIVFLFVWLECCEKTLTTLGKTRFYKLQPHFDRFRDIECLTADSIFGVKFRNSIRVYRIMEIIRPYVKMKSLTNILIYSSCVLWVFTDQNY